MFKYAKKGLTPSQIGVVLRDSFGIPQVKAVTGSKILRILKVHNTKHMGPRRSSRDSRQRHQARVHGRLIVADCGMRSGDRRQRH